MRDTIFKTPASPTKLGLLFPLGLIVICNFSLPYVTIPPMTKSTPQARDAAANTAIDKLMEKASQALVQMDYLTCENDCLQALSMARQAGEWVLYARILLPLQECRRQRRMTAADGWVMLGCKSAQLALDTIRDQGPGCLVLTHPLTPEQAQDLSLDLCRRKLYLELLYADNASKDNPWTLRSLHGPAVTATADAPPAGWLNRVLAENEPWPEQTTGSKSAPKSASKSTKGIKPRPSDWFINATEKLGDAALATVAAPLGSLERVDQLEACLRVVVDHEILHQRLADAARALTQAKV